MRGTPLLIAGLTLGMSGCVGMPLTPAEQVGTTLAPLDRPELSLQRMPGKPPVALNLAAFGPEGEGEVFEGGEVNDLISQFTGPPPKVQLTNPPRHDGSSKAELDVQPDKNQIGYVHYHLSAPEAMKLGEATLDGALMVMPYSGLFEGAAAKGKPANDPGQYIEQIVSALKPGAVLMVVDQKPNTGKADKARPRARKNPAAVDQFEAHGLDFIGSIPAAKHQDKPSAKPPAELKEAKPPDRVFDLYRKPDPDPDPGTAVPA
jgi:hypothetical protein